MMVDDQGLERKDCVAERQKDTADGNLTTVNSQPCCHSLCVSLSLSARLGVLSAENAGCP